MFTLEILKMLTENKKLAINWEMDESDANKSFDMFFNKVNVIIDKHMSINQSNLLICSLIK